MKKMTTKYKLEIAPLVDYFVIAVKDKDTDELVETFTLNESGVDMLKLFCEGKDTETVAKEMANIYEAPLQAVTADVMNFSEKLRKKGII